MGLTGYRVPRQQHWGDTVQSLIWNQVPAIMERSQSYFASLPFSGIYSGLVAKNIRDFRSALWDTLGREFTISGIGSLLDYERYGHEIRKPTPQLGYSGPCSGTSLCLEPTCFGFTEGVIENTNFIRNMCWSLSLPCVKDYDYSDMEFKRKLKQQFAMHFAQPPAVLEAYLRLHLLKNSIKVVATRQNFTYSGSVIGSAQGISLPFYIDEVDPMNLPDISTITGGIGGANLAAFENFVLPRLLAAGGFTGGSESVKVYGLKGDWQMAKEQTASVIDHFETQELLRALRSVRTDRFDDMFESFIHDPHFPTFNDPGTAELIPITQEHLEPSTIYGYVQTTNPAHALQNIRGLLFVPSNVGYELVEPPTDDYSSLLPGLDFNDTPGVKRLLSSQIFSANTLGPDGIVRFGHRVDAKGNIVMGASGLVPRAQALREAVRTDLILTHSNIECAPDGQLPNVGSALVPQGMADGFRMKSKMYVGTKWKGVAKPVMLLFQTDNPRSARPIEVCTVNNITVDLTAGYDIVACGPGNSTFVTLTFNKDVDTADFDVADEVAYRVGPKGATYLADVSVVSGNVVTITSSADPAEILPCCQGQKDDYGTMAELLNITNATAVSSEIMKASCNSGTGVLSLELFDPVAAGTAADTATITLQDGTVINVVLAADATGVFVTVSAAVGETCDLCDLDCACLVNAVYTNTEGA